MRYFKAFKLFAVPQKTLKDYVKKNNKTTEQPVEILIGKKAVSACEFIEDLVLYFLEMDRRFHVFGASDIKRLAHQLAISSGLKESSFLSW